jgi:hypothetical protein
MIKSITQHSNVQSNTSHSIMRKNRDNRRKFIGDPRLRTQFFPINLAQLFVSGMPARRGGREGDALNDATDPPASSAELPTTRSGLVREAPPTSKNRGRRGTDAHEEVDGAEVQTRMALGPIRDKPQGQLANLQLALQANAQLLEQFKGIAESYQISLGESH